MSRRIAPPIRPGGQAIPQDRIIVGMDVGTTKVCTLIADVAHDIPEILGVGICPSQGVHRGIVTDVEAASGAVAASLRRAEQQSGFKAMSAFVGISGAHVKCCAGRASVPIERTDRMIDARDIERVVESARVIELPAEQEIIHVIPRRFKVDDVGDLRQPIGLVGHRLEVEARVVSGSMTSIHKLVRCIEAVGVELDAIVLAPLAAGHAVLSQAERDLGSLVIDIGGGTTDAALFRGGGLLHASILPVGGYQLSNDLSYGLRLPLDIADQLKVQHGSTLARARPEGEPVPLGPPSRDREDWVEQCTVAEILDARLTETFEIVHNELLRLGFGGSYPAGIVLTGGSAQIPGACDAAAEVFEVPTRVAAAPPLSGLAEPVRGPTFCTSVGLVVWGGEQLRAVEATDGGGRIARLGAGVRQWLRNFLG